MSLEEYRRPLCLRLPVQLRITTTTVTMVLESSIREALTAPLVPLVGTKAATALAFRYSIAGELEALSTELTKGPPELIQYFHIGARALHVLNLIWFGNITRLSH
jgi:hypothetical protein